MKERLLSEELKALGYSTHIVGKWHLGYYKKEYTPTYRGFDSHYGFWNGYQDYYSHTSQESVSPKDQLNPAYGLNLLFPKSILQKGIKSNLVEYFIYKMWPNTRIDPFVGLDMRRNLEPDFESTGKYSTDCYTDEAVSIIRNHGSTCNGDCKKPLFLYVAYSAPHSGNFDDPLQAPADVISKFDYIEDEDRRKYAAMVWKLDESVGKIVAALDGSSMLQNSIIVFLSDNGAQTYGIHYNRGSNFPFKGVSAGRESNYVDRLPLDGVDVGEEIFEGRSWQISPPPHTYESRKEVLINIDDQIKYAAIRIGDYKLIMGTVFFGLQDHWVGESGLPNPSIPYYNTTIVQRSRAGRALRGRNGRSLSETDMVALRYSARIDCDDFWPPNGTNYGRNFPPCIALLKPCLFDVAHDPCEKRNLYRQLPDVANRLKRRLEELRATSVPPNNKLSDSRADPDLWNGTWTNWMDYPKPANYLIQILSKG
ncbi:hypothetical protein J437_LFUL000017 [Ladona fulva]|uniref:Sulfatase N-terminal domain-containing protein n=1 Tax=Ladona fulva TaxID=123851 RepID=A0A8K0JYV8_LADFU|nr:hypothetical protein J437_LFUL000017 [Ladona fulva]